MRAPHRAPSTAAAASVSRRKLTRVMEQAQAPGGGTAGKAAGAVAAVAAAAIPLKQGDTPSLSPPPSPLNVVLASPAKATAAAAAVTAAKQTAGAGAQLLPQPAAAAAARTHKAGEAAARAAGAAPKQLLCVYNGDDSIAAEVPKAVRALMGRPGSGSGSTQQAQPAYNSQSETSDDSGAGFWQAPAGSKPPMGWGLTKPSSSSGMRGGSASLGSSPVKGLMLVGSSPMRGLFRAGNESSSSGASTSEEEETKESPSGSEGESSGEGEACAREQSRAGTSEGMTKPQSASASADSATHGYGLGGGQGGANKAPLGSSQCRQKLESPFKANRAAMPALAQTRESDSGSSSGSGSDSDGTGEDGGGDGKQGERFWMLLAHLVTLAGAGVCVYGWERCLSFTRSCSLLDTCSTSVHPRCVPNILCILHLASCVPLAYTSAHAWPMQRTM